MDASLVSGFPITIIGMGTAFAVVLLLIGHGPMTSRLPDQSNTAVPTPRRRLRTPSAPSGLKRVEQKISDPFEWKAGKVTSLGFGQKIKHDDMIWLEKFGKAKPFEVRSVWRRKITWRLKIVRDPKTGAKRIVGVGQPQWSDAK